MLNWSSSHAHPLLNGANLYILSCLSSYSWKSFWLWPTLFTPNEKLSDSFCQFKEVWSSEQYDPCQSLVAKVNDDIEEAKPTNKSQKIMHWDGSDMLSKGTCQKRSQDVRRWRRRRRRRRPASWWESLRRRIPITWRRYGEETSKGYEQLLLVDHHTMIIRHLIESHG